MSTPGLESPGIFLNLVLSTIHLNFLFYTPRPAQDCVPEFGAKPSDWCRNNSHKATIPQIGRTQIYIFFENQQFKLKPKTSSVLFQKCRQCMFNQPKFLILVPQKEKEIKKKNTNLIKMSYLIRFYIELKKNLSILQVRCIKDMFNRLNK